MSEYTPTTGEVRERFIDGFPFDTWAVSRDQCGREFDRWLAARDRLPEVPDDSVIEAMAEGIAQFWAATDTPQDAARAAYAALRGAMQ